MIAQATFASITAAQEEAGITEVSLLNFAVSDGSTLIATRYVSHEDEEPASLYYAEGSAFQRCLEACPDLPSTPVPAACKAGAPKGPSVPCSPTANAASARNTAVAGEVRADFFAFSLDMIVQDTLRCETGLLPPSCVKDVVVDVCTRVHDRGSTA